MLDIKYIQGNTAKVKKAVIDKQAHVSIDALLTAYKKKNALHIRLDSLRAQGKKVQREVRDASDVQRKKLQLQGKQIKTKTAKLEKKFKEKEHAYVKLLHAVPNIPTDDTPRGDDETKNVVIRQVGTKPTFKFRAKNHWELGVELELIDLEKGTNIAGTRFTYIKNELVLLEFAMISFVFSVVTQEKILTKIFKKYKINVSAKPFVPILPPVFVRTAVLSKMDRLEPIEDRYQFEKDGQFLVGSAEHTLGPLHMNESIIEDKLPIRYIGFSTCFRREAGSHGKDMKGIIRMHQFDKLEMESFTTKENGLIEQEALVAIQEYIMSSLELPYQVVAISTGDMGKPAARQIDLETWMPGQQKYRETHSADYVTDYQARRLKTFITRETGKELAHMNDATALAFSRIFAAIIENYQTEKGSVRIPSILIPLMNGLKEISRD